MQVNGQLHGSQLAVRACTHKNRTREHPRPVFSCVDGLYASGRLRFRKSIVMHQRPAMPTIA